MSDLSRSLSLKLWWKKPRNAGDKPLNRNVSYLELFYDLVYVVLMSKISHSLVHHFSMGGIGIFCFLFTFLWLNWYNGAIYHDLHAKNDIRTRLFTFIEMFIVIFMAMFTDNAVGPGAIGFAICMGVYHFYWSFLWWRTGVHDADHTSVAYPLSINHLILATLFIISVFLPSPYIYYLWFVILFISVIIKVINLDYGNKIEHNRQVSIVISPTHSIVERFSLFTIIVFGEIIIGLVNGMTIEHFNLMMAFKSVVGFFIVICFWSLYYDLISGKFYRKSKKNYFFWVYLHLLFTMAVVLVGSTLSIVVDRFEPVEDLLVKNTFVASFSLALFFIGMLAKRVDHDKKYTRFNIQTTRILFLSCFMLLGFLAFNANVFCILLVMICDIVIIIFSSYYFFIKSITNNNCPYRVRPENRNDYTRISRIIRDAFSEEKYDQQNEQSLVVKLRSDEAYIPELALVFEDVLLEEIGYCLFTKVYDGSNVDGDKGLVVMDKVLFLGSTVLSPEYKNKGLENILMEKVEERALENGYKLLILVGDEAFFEKYGFQDVSKHDIRLSFGLNKLKCLGKGLTSDAWDEVSGDLLVSDILKAEYNSDKVSISL